MRVMALFQLHFFAKCLRWRWSLDGGICVILTHFLFHFFIFFQDIEGIAKAGKVDCTAERYLCQQAGIRAYPTVRFYKGVKKRGQAQVQLVKTLSQKIRFSYSINNKLIKFFLYFPENKVWNFMQDNLHEMSNFIFC